MKKSTGDNVFGHTILCILIIINSITAFILISLIKSMLILKHTLTLLQFRFHF